MILIINLRGKKDSLIAEVILKIESISVILRCTTIMETKFETAL